MIDAWLDLKLEQKKKSVTAVLDGILFVSIFFLFFSAICDSEPEQPVRNCPLWVKVEGEVDPEPIYVPTPSVIEPVRSVVPPSPEVLLPSKNRSSSGTKAGRVYTPKPNPVVREKKRCMFFLVLKIKTNAAKSFCARQF